VPSIHAQGSGRYRPGISHAGRAGGAFRAVHGEGGL